MQIVDLSSVGEPLRFLTDDRHLLQRSAFKRRLDLMIGRLNNLTSSWIHETSLDMAHQCVWCVLHLEIGQYHEGSVCAPLHARKAHSILLPSYESYSILAAISNPPPFCLIAGKKCGLKLILWLNPNINPV